MERNDASFSAAPQQITGSINRFDFDGIQYFLPHDITTIALFLPAREQAYQTTSRRAFMRFLRTLSMTTCLTVAMLACPCDAALAADTATHEDNTILLTVFLHHDQSKNLAQINQELKKNGYFDQFPPAGVTVESWYVVMGIGQVVTLRVPADKLRAVNTALENTAWGPFRTEFFPTYDYKALAEKQRQEMRNTPP